MTRRDFIKAASVATAGAAIGVSGAAQPEPRGPGQQSIPRWRGFNLTELTGGDAGRRFVESDFDWMAEWGFDFARLPMSYWAWADPEDWMNIREKDLEPIDEAIEWGRQRGIHVNLNLHRIPGYCVNRRELEPYLLFDSPRDSMQRALEAANHHWRTLAERYRDISAKELSFDLFNEPPWMDTHDRYVEIAKSLVATIREVSPDRLVVADGADIGQTPVPGLFDLGLVQSTRGYLPKMVSHYTATWVPENEFESFEPPTWPMRDAQGVLWNKAKLKSALIDPWKPAVAAGVPVHVGEWGCYNETPHDAFLGWARDLMSLWKEAGWGWSMWNLRGAFGVVDSGRKDVDYEDWRGHKLDRKLLELLRAN